MDYTNGFTQGLVTIASLGFLAAAYYTYRLSQETRGEKYWVFFLLAALAMGAEQWLDIPHELGLLSKPSIVMLAEGAAIIGALRLG